MPASETDRLELIERHEPDSRKDRLELIREIVAMANAGGGEIHLGVSDDGQRPGLATEVVNRLDPADVQSFADEFVKPDHVHIERRVENGEAGDVVVIIVSSTGDHPLVFTKPGDYEDEEGRSRQVFAKHAVYRRRGTKAEPARRDDYRAWIDRAVAKERHDWMSRVAVLSKLPPGASLEIVTDTDEAMAEPAILLRTHTRLFNRNPEKLLTKHDLALLFLARDELEPRDDESRLLLHSAFRRRPTLYFWLDILDPSPATIAEIIDETISGSDRDKSDAARSVVECAALYLEPDEFDEVVTRLGESEYAHFREHAAEATSPTSVITRLVEARDNNLDDAPLREWSEHDLTSRAEEEAQQMLSSTGYDSASRRLARIGTELFLRHRLRDP